MWLDTHLSATEAGLRQPTGIFGGKIVLGQPRRALGSHPPQIHICVDFIPQVTNPQVPPWWLTGGSDLVALLAQQWENWRHIWPPTTALDVFTDACTDAGGAFCGGNLLYAHWTNDVPRLTPHHINTKELAAVVMAAQALSHVWANHHVVVFTDNRVTEAAVNNGTARNSTCLHFLKHLAALALQFNFDISEVYIPGVYNTIADTISRLHEPGKLNLLSSHLKVSVPCLLQSISMSAKSRLFLFQGFPGAQPCCN